MQKRRGGFSALTWEKRVERFWQCEALGQFWFPDGQSQGAPCQWCNQLWQCWAKREQENKAGNVHLPAWGPQCSWTRMCAYLCEVLSAVELNVCLPAWSHQYSWTGICAYPCEVLKAVRLERVLTCVRSSMQLDWNVCLPPWGPQCSWTVVHAYLCEIFKAVGLESVFTCVRSSMQLDWSESVSSETGRHWGTADKEVRTFPCSSRVWNITAHKLNQHLRFLQAEKQPLHWHNWRNTIVWNTTARPLNQHLCFQQAEKDPEQWHNQKNTTVLIHSEVSWWDICRFLKKTLQGYRQRYTKECV